MKSRWALSHAESVHSSGAALLVVFNVNVKISNSNYTGRGSADDRQQSGNTFGLDA